MRKNTTDPTVPNYGDLHMHANFESSNYLIPPTQISKIIIRIRVYQKYLKKNGILICTRLRSLIIYFSLSNAKKLWPIRIDEHFYIQRDGSPCLFAYIF